MKNTTNVKVPKKYQNRIVELYHDEDGYWCYMEAGYYAGGMGSYDECHTIHEDTVSELLYQIRRIMPL